MRKKKIQTPLRSMLADSRLAACIYKVAWPWAKIGINEEIRRHRIKDK